MSDRHEIVEVSGGKPRCECGVVMYGPEAKDQKWLTRAHNCPFWNLRRVLFDRAVPHCLAGALSTILINPDGDEYKALRAMMRLSDQNAAVNAVVQLHQKNCVWDCSKKEVESLLIRPGLRGLASYLYRDI